VKEEKQKNAFDYKKISHGLHDFSKETRRKK
jgi:hypothetical protein